MSHISVLQTKLVDRSILIEALTKLGYTVKEGDNLEVHGLEKSIKVDLMIDVPYSAPIGFRQSSSGFKIVADWFKIQLDQKTFTNQIMQQYAYISVMKTLAKQGFQVIKEETGEKNQIHLLLRRTN